MKANHKHLLVVNVIPTYNEKESIAKMIFSINKSVKNNPKYIFKTLIVDDKSPDGTAAIVKKLKKKNKQSLYLISHSKEGLGKAMIRGILYAMNELNADIVITNEADFSYNPNKIPFMLKKIEEGFDIVVASRHTLGGATQGWTVMRKLNHFIANYFFATLIAGNFITSDHNGAFRAIRVKGVLDKIDLRNMNVRGFAFFNYSLFRLTKISKKYYEFPIKYKFRTVGESKVSFNPKYIKTYFRDVLEYIYLCLRCRFYGW